MFQRYGTVQKQIDCILSDFKNLRKCNDVSSTLNMISIVEKADADLKCMDAASQMENELIISYIKKSMPEPERPKLGRKELRMRVIDQVKTSCQNY